MSCLEGYKAVTQPKGTVARIIQYLGRCERGQDIPAAQVQEALNIQIRKLKSDLENDWDLILLGYEYQSASKGRGHSAVFKLTG